MANEGIAPPNFTTSVGKVRVLLGDTDPTNIVDGEGVYLFFSDTEIEALLDMHDDNVKLTAARCMETIAGSQALLLKAWSSDDLTVNGDRIAKELRELAKQLRAEAVADESSESFNVIPFPVTELETWWN